MKKFLQLLARQTKSEPFTGVEPAGKGFEPLYSQEEHESLPWFLPTFDPDFESALELLGPPPKRVIDIGTGSGIQAVELAKMGYETWASDFSSAALEYGKEAACQANVCVNFRVDDVCRSKLTDQTFDAAFDRGCFHILPPAQRLSYLDTLKQMLSENALLFLKCFSHEEPPRPGPFRFSEGEIESFFSDDFKVIEICPTEFHGSRPVHPKALFAVLRRR